MKFAYYPGCSLHVGAKEYDSSLRAVCKLLGIDLTEMADWNCCGTVHATNVNRTYSYGLAARNLGIAERMGLDVAAPCSGCYKNLRAAAEALKADAELQVTVNGGLAQPYGANTRVKHPLYIITQDVGLDNLPDVAKPLNGLRVAPYYGCVLTRPVYPEAVDDSEDPQAMDRLLEALGATVVDFPAKTKCCGGAVLLSHPEVSIELTSRLLAQAKQAEADCLALACPMCQMALDGYQRQAEQQLGEPLGLPVLYFTQLMALALGVDTRQIGLGQLFVSPAKALAPILES